MIPMQLQCVFKIAICNLAELLCQVQTKCSLIRGVTVCSNKKKAMWTFSNMNKDSSIKSSKGPPNLIQVICAEDIIVSRDWFNTFYHLQLRLFLRIFHHRNEDKKLISHKTHKQTIPLANRGNTTKMLINNSHKILLLTRSKMMNGILGTVNGIKLWNCWTKANRRKQITTIRICPP